MTERGSLFQRMSDIARAAATEHRLPTAVDIGQRAEGLPCDLAQVQHFRSPRWMIRPEVPRIRPHEPLPMIEGGWKMVAADPAWRFKSWTEPQTDEQKKAARAADKHYDTMTLEEILALPVKDVVARDCHCFLWIPGPFLNKAEQVLNAWGFKFSTDAFVWIKLRRGLGRDQYQLLTPEEFVRLLHMGTGHTTRKNAEFCILGRRGNPDRLAADVHEIIVSVVGEHSRKPDEFFERVERYAPGPRLELFSRQPREGWTTWGNQTQKFAK